MDPGDEFAEQLGRVRPTTRQLIESVMMDAWPNNAAITDFGLDSQAHYEALYYPIREGEIMPAALDEALGHGRKLTELARACPSNPHKGVEFSTSWDGIFGRPVPDRALSEEAKLEANLSRLLGRDSAGGDPLPTPSEFERLKAELRDDEAQRPLHEKGVDYGGEHEHREETTLGRVEREVAKLKESKLPPAFAPSSDPIPWDEQPEGSKLYLLETRVNWWDVPPGDHASVLRREVDQDDIPTLLGHAIVANIRLDHGEGLTATKPPDPLDAMRRRCRDRSRGAAPGLGKGPEPEIG